MMNKVVNSSARAQSGFGYFLLGFELIKQKGLKRFVLIPLLINMVLFSIAFYYGYQQLDYYLTSLESLLPDWLSWLNYIIWPFAIITILVMFSFLFSSVANWIAAPFNGLLAEKVELLLSNKTAPSGTLGDVVKDIPRTLSREWTKLKYYLPRAIGFLLILWLIPLIGQICWFLFSAWMMAIQYKDYAFDNHKIPFNDMRTALADNRSLSFSFGIATLVFSMIPLVNLIVMPVAICGATALWVDHYQSKYA
jgi:CysZ protein